MKNIFCPISKERINEQIPRITALLVILLVIAGFGFHSPIIFLVLLADFGVRAFTKVRFSLLSCVAYWLATALRLPEKPIDKAPKIFAARMGFVMVLALSILNLAGFLTASKVIAGILVFFAGLEFSIAFCAGCTIYTLFVLPFYKNS